MASNSRMGEKSKKPRKNYVSEVDVSTLLQRYTATTVLTLLQEVAQVQDSKIDWNVLAKKSTTGISNPREYQMLWRHLAYRDDLLDKIDDVAQPLDDDSDLECELEAFPAVSNDALAEATACVKVLIASGMPNDPAGSTVEAPLTINIPKGQMTKSLDSPHSSTFAHGTNITVPISVQKQSLPSVAGAEVLDSNGAANANLPRRKRKPWSDAEDTELIAAVQKCGEGNWANILKSDFKGDRTASQLSQRWAIIRKRKGSNLIVGTSSQISELQLAARRAMSLALNMPMGDTLKSSSVIRGTNGKIGQPSTAETSSTVTSLPATQNDSLLAAGQQAGTAKSRVAATKKPSTKSSLSPDSMVKAAAVAAGARVATPSDAAALLKAAQSRNAVHIMPGSSLLKSAVPGSSNSLPSNVHFLCSGLAPKPLSAHSAAPVNSQAGGTQQVPGPSTKLGTPIIQPNSAVTAPESTAASEVRSVTTSLSTSEAEVRTTEDSAAFSTPNTAKEQLQEDQAGFQFHRLKEQVKGNQNTFSGNTLKEVQEDKYSLGNLNRDQVEGGRTPVLGKGSEVETRGDEVSAPANAPLQHVQDGQSDPPVSDMSASNGYLGPAGSETTIKSESTSKDRPDSVKPVPVKQIGDNDEKNCEKKHTSESEEGPVSMDIDGDDLQKNQKQVLAGDENNTK